jgi:hypothetical protein
MSGRVIDAQNAAVPRAAVVVRFDQNSEIWTVPLMKSRMRAYSMPNVSTTNASQNVARSDSRERKRRDRESG